VKSILLTKDLGMALARLDPYRIAPVVVTGIYCILQIVEGGDEDINRSKQYMKGIFQIVAYWTCVEEYEIGEDTNRELQKKCNELEKRVVEMYKEIIQLLVTLISYSKSKWGMCMLSLSQSVKTINTSITEQTKNALIPKTKEWEHQKMHISSLHHDLTLLRSEIAIIKEASAKSATILKWISSHQFLTEYNEVQSRTGKGSKYESSCEWLTVAKSFQEWCEPGQSSTLWLRGTIGTGKTALMSRAMRHVRKFQRNDFGVCQLATFFFRKASAATLDEECCFRSLVRQLSWDSIELKVKPLMKREYEKFQNRQASDNSLTTADCIKLLVSLLNDAEVYIMIDGIDECEESGKLLKMLKDITPDPTKESKGHLHLMLCGRNDLPIREHYLQCPIIESTSDASKKDHDIFVKTEIERLQEQLPGSRFAMSTQNFPQKFEKELKRCGQGFFRWTEIQLQYLWANSDLSDELKEELEKLSTRIPADDLVKKDGRDLNREYERLLKRAGLYPARRELTIKMLKLITCSVPPLSTEMIAHAITVSEAQSERDKVDEELVQKRLTGFVNPLGDDRGIWGSSGIALAHASVYEYLIFAEETRDDFALFAQHSQAASICFASVSHGAQSPLADAFEGHAHLSWPRHCKEAYANTLDKARLDELVKDIAKFISSNQRLPWQCVQGEEWSPAVISKIEKASSSVPVSLVPAFVGLHRAHVVELHTIEEIWHTMESPYSWWSSGRKKEWIRLDPSTPATFEYLLQIKPEKIEQADLSYLTLMLTLYRQFPHLFSAYASNSTGLACLRQVSRQLERTLMTAISQESLDTPPDSYWVVIEFLLTSGRKLWVCDEDCRDKSDCYNSLVVEAGSTIPIRTISRNDVPLATLQLLNDRLKMLQTKAVGRDRALALLKGRFPIEIWMQIFGLRFMAIRGIYHH